MDISLLSILLFILITIGHFTVPSIGKHPLTVEIVESPEKYASYLNSNLSRLGLYILFVIVTQFILNIGYIINKCGGSPGPNILAAAGYTFVPWTIMFGLMIIVIVMYPGLKSAFADVVGYFVVASSANTLLTSLLIDPATAKIDKKHLTTDNKDALHDSASAIMKIFGNTSLLINQITPDNFLAMWKILEPLMRKNLKGTELKNKQKELLDIVVRRDNIGEGMWYVYTAILVSSIVYYNLATRGCVQDMNQIATNREKYIEEQEKVQKETDLNNTTTYTV